MSLRDPEYYMAVTMIRDGVEGAKWKTAYMKLGGGTEKVHGTRLSYNRPSVSLGVSRGHRWLCDGTRRKA